jgi:pimeloyl-ACP methyl ester carboxylesterase
MAPQDWQPILQTLKQLVECSRQVKKERRMSTVTSKDSTTIAYGTIGAGPALLVVDGALGYRGAFGGDSELARLLAPHFTVYSYDRRGRGGSSDMSPFAVAREVEDIAALIDAAGGEAYLYGMSSGGALALEAALGLPTKVKKLAIYEVPYDNSDEGIQAWHGYRTKLDVLTAAGQRGDAVALFMQFVGVPADMIAGMRQSPMWTALEAVAPTLPYDAAALGADRTVPTERAATLTMPTLIMDGGASYEIMPFMRATAEALTQAIPHAEHRILEEQGHDIDPKAVAPVLTAFFGS